MDQHLPEVIPDGRGLDVGAKNGVYLPGLAAALPCEWDSVEVDAHRRYLSGTTRRAYGEAIAAALQDCRFLADDVRNVPGRYAVVTWLLPFVTEAPLVWLGGWRCLPPRPCWPLRARFGHRFVKQRGATGL